MRYIILHTAKAIANDPERPGVLVFNDAGTVLSVLSEGLTAEDAAEWVRSGAAARCPAPASKADA